MTVYVLMVETDGMQYEVQGVYMYKEKAEEVSNAYAFFYIDELKVVV